MTLHNFEGNKPITLQPGTETNPYKFKITVCSSAVSNDGYIPFGTSVAGVVVTAFKDDGTDVSSTLIDGVPTEEDNVVTVLLNYISTAGEYYLRFVLTLNTGSVVSAYFKNVKVRSS